MKSYIRFARVLFVCMIFFAGSVVIGSESLTLRVSIPSDGIDIPVCAGIATLKRGAATRLKQFSWKDRQGQYLDLLFDGHKVTRYMYTHDTSSEQRAFETYKPFHHVYDASGNLLTKGPDGEHPYLRDKILYPHHRGIFIGWNRLTFEGKRYDLWHMPQAHMVHQKFLEPIAGSVLARSTGFG
jgi:hypothetical protein